MNPFQKADELIRDAQHEGFFWPKREDIFDKLDEEILELYAAGGLRDRDGIVSELGDVLFLLTALAIEYGTTLEEAMTKVNQRFQERYQRMVNSLEGVPLRELSFDQMTRAWRQAK